MTAIAGGYTCTYNSLSVGQIEDGINLIPDIYGEPIRGDNFGDTIQDGVFRGADVYAEMTLIEYDLALLTAAFWPWSATFGKLDDGIVGKLWTALAKALVLTKVSGPNASPTSLTASKAILAPNFPVNLLFAPRLRRVPLRLLLLPYAVSSNNYVFTLT